LVFILTVVETTKTQQNCLITDPIFGQQLTLAGQNL